MESEAFEKIRAGTLCPYCFGDTEFLPDSSQLYGNNYGPVYICWPCEAYVGCHRGTHKALGRVANFELRQARKKAHGAFDPIFKGRLIKKLMPEYMPQTTWRQKAYIWLAQKMGLQQENCHIALFDVEQCNQVIEIATKATCNE